MISAIAPALVTPAAQAPKTTVQRGAPSDRSGAAAELLLRAVGGKSSPTLVPELSALGPDVVPFLFQVLMKGGVPVGTGEGHVVEMPGELEDTVRAALAKLPREPVLRHLLASAASTDFREREVSLRVLGAFGTDEHLELLGKLAAPVGPSPLVPPRVRSAFQDALGLVLARDAKALAGLRDLYTHLPPALVLPMLRAAAEGPSVRVIEMCSALLGVRPESDLLLLCEISRLAESPSAPIPRAVCAKPRRYLSERNPERLSAAVTVAGVLEDHEAVPELVKLLGSADPRVASQARSSLKRIAHKDLGPEPERWNDWYNAETEWWTSKFASLAAALSGRDRARAVEAVQQLARRRLLRDDVASLLADGLRRPEPDLVVMCCQALGNLRSPIAVTALESVLHHDVASIREAAGRSLAQIAEPRRRPGSSRTALETP